MFGNQLTSAVFGQQAIQNPPPNYDGRDADQTRSVMKPDFLPSSFDTDVIASQEHMGKDKQDESTTGDSQVLKAEKNHSTTADWSNNIGWEVAEMFISAHVKEMTKKVFADEQQAVAANGERVLLEELTLEDFLSAVDHEPSILGWLDLYSMIF